MENLSHTLCGLALARCGFGRLDPMATVAMAVAANAPDLDLVVWLVDRPAGYMLTHRGTTHAVFGCAVGGLIIGTAFAAVGRRLGKPSRALPLALAASVGCLSHLVLDWLNTYGVRPWAPFDYARYHLDATFIAEPVFWALFGLAAISASAWRARGLVVAAALFVALQAHLAGVALERGAAAVRAAAPAERIVAASPHPQWLACWRWVALVETDARFHYVEVDLARGTASTSRAVARRVDDPALEALRATREYEAWRFWARHPFVGRDREGRLILGDARYNPEPVADWCSLAVAAPGR